MLSKELTIVIPTKNEEKYIGYLLRDLLHQYDIKNTKIVIADSSDDGTLDVVVDFQRRFGNILNIIVTEGGTVSRARNNGFRYCNTDYILFLDADVRLRHHFHIYDCLIRLKAKKFHNKKALLTSPIYCYSNDWKCKWGYKIYNLIHKKLTNKYPFAIGGFFMVDCESFKKFGKFNEMVDNSEDFLFSQNYSPNDFIISKYKMGLDDRRFKKIGYWNTIKHLLTNLYKFIKKDKEHFNKKSGYWG
jgi:glycosyltransferase involved in cell wall biosynthesis